MHGEHREEQIGVKNMRVIILENCVVEGSVWFAGEEVFVDEALGAMMVQAGKAREMEGPNPPTPFPEREGGVEVRVVRAKERAVSKRERVS